MDKEEKNNIGICTNCKCEIILDKEEIALGRFICPSCGKENVFKAKGKINFTNKRIPFIAAFLSFFCPGLGHIYCGELRKGIVLYFLAYIATVLILFMCMLFSAYFIIPIIILYVSVIVSSVQSAKRKLEYNLKFYNIWIIYVVIIALNIFIFSPFIKSEFVESYELPTSSMENAVLKGDYILVSKLFYGLHFPFTNKYLYKLNKPGYNDLIVYISDDISSPGYIREDVKYIKRCIALPGDTISIVDRNVNIDNKIQPNPYTLKFSSNLKQKGFIDPKIYPKGSKWNEDNYGPIRVPKSGDIIRIDSSNYSTWENIINKDRHKCRISNDNKVYVDEIELKDNEYRVEKDYLFVMGDNRNNSLDSRFTGLVSTDDILGKAYSVYFSLNDNDSIPNSTGLLKSVRWNRISMKLK